MSSSYRVPTSADMLRARLFLCRVARENIASPVTVPLWRYNGNTIDRLSFISMGLEWVVTIRRGSPLAREIYEKMHRLSRLVDGLATAGIEFNDRRVAEGLAHARSEINLGSGNMTTAMRLFFACRNVRELQRKVGVNVAKKV